MALSSPCAPTSSGLLLTTLLGAFSSACSDDGPVLLHDVTYESESLIVRANPALEMCAGSVEHLERFIDLSVQSLPVGRAPQRPVIYQHLTDEDFTDNGVCENGVACTSAGVIFSRDGLDLHELTHGLRQRAYSDRLPGPLILEEGQASLYSYEYIGTTERHLGAEDLAVTSPWDNIMGDQYPASAHFVAYLHETIGAQGTAVFLQEAQGVDGIADYAAPYERATHRDWTEDLGQYNAYPLCETWSMVHRPVECGDVPPALDLGSAREHTVTFNNFSCGEPEAIGPLNGRIWGYQAVDVPAFAIDADYYVEFTAPEEVELEFQVISCDGGCRGTSSRYRSAVNDRAVGLKLKPGRSVIRFAVASSTVADIELFIEKL